MGAMETVAGSGERDEIGCGVEVTPDAPDTRIQGVGWRWCIQREEGFLTALDVGESVQRGGVGYAAGV